MSNTFTELYNQFMVYAEKGDEQGARNFLIDNLEKFPEDLQEKITFAFFEEAMQKEAQGDQAIAELQKQGLDAISQIDKAKKILEDKIKERDLRTKLKQ